MPARLPIALIACVCLTLIPACSGNANPTVSACDKYSQWLSAGEVRTKAEQRDTFKPIYETSQGAAADMSAGATAFYRGLVEYADGHALDSQAMASAGDLMGKACAAIGKKLVDVSASN